MAAPDPDLAAARLDKGKRLGIMDDDHVKISQPGGPYIGKRRLAMQTHVSEGRRDLFVLKPVVDVFGKREIFRCTFNISATPPPWRVELM